MSQIVVDTDVASYIFNWHSSARRYVDALRGFGLILSFMSIAEMRMAPLRLVGAFGGAPFSNSLSEVSMSFMPTTLSAPLGLRCGPTLGRPADH